MRLGTIPRGSVEAPRRPRAIEIKSPPAIAAVEQSKTTLAELELQLARMLRNVFVRALPPPDSDRNKRHFSPFPTESDRRKRP
jgi:hypothetical protein